MAKTSGATLKAINKYNKEKTDEFKIRLPKGNKSLLKEYTRIKGTSTTELITELLTERLAQDGYRLITREEVAQKANERDTAAE